MMEEDDDEVPQLVDDDHVAPTEEEEAWPVGTSAAAASVSTAGSETATAAVVQPAATSAPAPYVRDPNDPPVPLSILTGWLGAGKTTLLTRILAHFASRGEIVAVIQNEASFSGVEMGLQLEDDSGAFTNLIELSNGCICCSVKSDFVMGVEELLKRKKFAYILVECSGLADPGPLAQVFWVDPEAESTVYLDGIISLVDGVHFLRHLTSLHELESAQVVHQIAYADRIVLNKMDLVTSEQEREECIRKIRDINQAEIHCTTKSEVDLDQILNIKAFDVNDTTRSVVMPALESAGDAASHPHDATITTWMCDDLALPLSQRRPVDLRRLKLWLADLLWQDTVEPTKEELEATAATAAAAPAAPAAAVAAVAAESSTTSVALAPIIPVRPNSIFRLKGILAVDGESRPTFLQGVQTLFDLQPGDVWPKLTQPEAQRFTRMVFIGRHLDPVTLLAGFQSIFVQPAA